MKLSDIPKWLPKLQELAEGMKAGKRIQFTPISGGMWLTLKSYLLDLNFDSESPDQYRVEPEPVIPREVWVLKHVATGATGGLVFCSIDEAHMYLIEHSLDFTHKPVKFVEVVDE